MDRLKGHAAAYEEDRQEESSRKPIDPLYANNGRCRSAIANALNSGKVMSLMHLEPDVSVTWYLPDGYEPNLEPDYHHDESSEIADVVHQPEAYELVRYLLSATGRGMVIDVGCGSGRKLRELAAPRKMGIDYGANLAFCRTHFPSSAEWVEANFSDAAARLMANHANRDSIVICADVVEHMPDPTHLLALLADSYRRGAIVITTTPDRIRVRGLNDRGPPANTAHVREWALQEYTKVMADAGIPITFAGYTTNNDNARELKTILTLSDPDCGSFAIPRNASRPLAIIAAYNEDDILHEVITDWLSQGCDVHLIDNWSTDSTWEIAQAHALDNPARVTVERFPEAPQSTFAWIPLLHRKADVAALFPGRWIIHSDADEIRRSPFPGVTMADALDLVTTTGANRVDFRVVNFSPTDASRSEPGNVQHSLQRFRFGTRVGHLQQSKAWMQGGQRVDLASTGGHEARFDAASDFRYKFLLKHYPLRSSAHARRKVEQDRQGRRSPYEGDILNFHKQYDHLVANDFDLEAGAELIEWDKEGFWKDYGLLIMTDLIDSRVERGWMDAGQ